MNRLKLVLILATMPSEAFGWIVPAIAHNIYPPGLGKFLPESRAAIEAARAEALSLLEGGDSEHL
jgi:hypothetical protein